jgi:tRNA threonylcarbamoyladenosine biosynthesis protein TsaE
MKLRIVSKDEAQTEEVGAQIAKMLRSGSVICLYGPLGAGKTVFAKAVAGALGVRQTVSSPSFVFVHEYGGDEVSVYHIDLYRIDNEADLAELGLDEYLGGEGVCIIEWADRLGSELPDERIDVHIDFCDDARTIEISASGRIEAAAG